MDASDTRRDAVAVLLAVAGAGVLLTSGTLRSADYLVALGVACNAVDRGSLEATPPEGFPDFAVRDGPDGRPYSRFGLGHSALGVPACLAGRALAAAAPEGTRVLGTGRIRFDRRDDPEQAWAALFAALTGCLVAGALAASVLILARRLGATRGESFLAAALASPANPLFFLASDFTAEPPSALCLVLAALALLRVQSSARQGRSDAGAALAFGAAMGATVVLKVAHGVLLLPGAVALALALRPLDRRGALPAAAAIGSAAACLALVAAYNGARFGTLLETGYTDASEFGNPAWEGALGQLVSPGRGLLWHFPAIVLAVAGAAALARASGPVAMLTWGALAALWALYSPWHAWEGGWTVGPRLLAPALALPAIPGARMLARSRGALRAGAWVLALATLAAGLLPFAFDYVDYGFWLWRARGDDVTFAMRWSIEDAPLVAGWTFPARRSLLLARCLAEGFPGPLAAVFGAAVASIVAGIALALGRRRGS